MSCDTNISGRKSALKLDASSHFLENSSSLKGTVNSLEWI